VGCFKDKSGNSNNFQKWYWDWAEWPNQEDPRFAYRLSVYRSNGLNDSLPAIHFFGTTEDASEEGTPTAVAGNPLSLKYETFDFESRTIIFVGDFTKVVGGPFTEGRVFRGQSQYLRIMNNHFRNEAFNSYFEATEDGVDGQFLTVAMEANQASPTENTSKREMYIEGNINPDYIELKRRGNENSFDGFVFGSQNQGGQVSVKDLFLSEFIFYDKYLPMEERQKVEGYVACKWNLRFKLPSDHPYSPSAAEDLGCPFRKN